MTRRSAHLLLTFAASLFATLSQAEELPQAEYSVRQPIPYTGSSIRRNVVWSSPIPVNRTYAQLTPDQKASVHALYERVEAGDEPPFPAEGLKAILLAIWKGLSARQVSGTLSLVADVSSTGDVVSVEVLESPDLLLSRYGASVLMATKFKPAVCKGQPCRMQYPFRMTTTFQ